MGSRQTKRAFSLPSILRAIIRGHGPLNWWLLRAHKSALKNRIFLLRVCPLRLLYTNTLLMGEEVLDLQTTGGYKSVLEKYHCCLPCAYTAFPLLSFVLETGPCLWKSPETCSQLPSHLTHYTRDSLGEISGSMKYGDGREFNGMDAGISQGQTSVQLHKLVLEPATGGRCVTQYRRL